MKEIYIKGDMPKSCWECPCFRNNLEQPCGLDDENKGYFLDEIDGGECPLKQFPQSTKELMDKEQLAKYKSYKTTDEHIKNLTDLYVEYKEQNTQLNQQLAKTEKALELAVADKCKFENEWLSMVVGMPNGKLLVPKKEQWYLEQAEKELNNGS